MVGPKKKDEKREVDDAGCSKCVKCRKTLPNDKFRDEKTKSCEECLAHDRKRRQEMNGRAAIQHVKSKRVEEMERKTWKAEQKSHEKFPPDVQFEHFLDIYHEDSLFPTGATINDILSWAQSKDGLAQREYARVEIVQTYGLTHFERGEDGVWRRDTKHTAACGVLADLLLASLREAAKRYRLATPLEPLPIDADFNPSEGRSVSFASFLRRLQKIIVAGLSMSSSQLASRIIRTHFKACLCWSAQLQGIEPSAILRWEEFSGVALLRLVGGSTKVASLVPEILASAYVSEFVAEEYPETDYAVYSTDRFVFVLPPRSVGDRRMRGAVWNAGNSGYRWPKGETAAYRAPFDGQLLKVQETFESMGGDAQLVPRERYFSECYDSGILEHVRAEGFERDARSFETSYEAVLFHNESGIEDVSGKYALLVNVAGRLIIWSTDTHLFFKEFSLCGVRFADMMRVGDDDSIKQVERDGVKVDVNEEMCAGSRSIVECAIDLRSYVQRADPMMHKVPDEGDDGGDTPTNVFTGTKWELDDRGRKANGIEHALNTCAIYRVIESRYPEELGGLAALPSKVDRLCRVDNVEERIKAKVDDLEAQIHYGAFDVSLYTREGLAKHIASRPRNTAGSKLVLNRNLFATPKPPFPTCDGVFYLQQWKPNHISHKKILQEIERLRRARAVRN